MNEFLAKYAAILFLFSGISAAQTGATRVYTVPDGLLIQSMGSFIAARARRSGRPEACTP